MNNLMQKSLTAIWLSLILSAVLLHGQGMFTPWSCDNELYFHRHLQQESTAMTYSKGAQGLILLLPAISYSKKAENVSLGVARLSYMTDHWLFVSSALLDAPLATEPAYPGKVWRGFAGYVDESFIRYSSRKGLENSNLFFAEAISKKWYEKLTDPNPRAFLLQMGRSYLRSGRSFDENLLLGWTSQPYPNVTAKWWLGKHIQFQASAIELNKETHNGIRYNRFASMHRGVINLLNNRLSLGFTEAVVYGGVNRQFELSYINPVNIWHAEQLNGGGEANTLVLFDGEYRFSKGRIYYEFLIDDFQIENKVPGDREPNELGWIIGYNAVNIWKEDYLTLEYSGITNRTYNPPQPFQRWEYLGTPLAHSLENDFDRWMMEYVLLHGIHQFTLKLEHIRKGEGGIFVPFDDSFLADDWPGESFPSGKLSYHSILSFAHGICIHQNYAIDYGIDWHFQEKSSTLFLQLTIPFSKKFEEI
ncbi:MAG TPA: hypothetical protein ENN84_07445 [Candidatus Marinimicrobia bacterium]|nr:hypothetical protein [Candidatus Neomarinimicrobiota bacterium]